MMVEFWFIEQCIKEFLKKVEKMNMDSLLNASGLSGQQLPNNHFVDSQVTEKLEFFVVVVSKLLSKNLNFHNYFLICESLSDGNFFQWNQNL